MKKAMTKRELKLWIGGSIEEKFFEPDDPWRQLARMLEKGWEVRINKVPDCFPWVEFVRSEWEEVK